MIQFAKRMSLRILYKIPKDEFSNTQRLNFFVRCYDKSKKTSALKGKTFFVVLN